MNIIIAYRIISLLSCVIAIILSFSLPTTDSYVITIDAATENECFHELVTKGVKLGFSFEVIDGGFYDVDIAITDPKNAIIYQDDKTSNGKFTFEADMDGRYQFCFSNARSSKSPKLLMFDIDRSDTGKPKTDETGKTDQNDDTVKLKEMLNTLLVATTTSRHDVRYLTARDKVHRQVNEESNSRILWWSAVEFVLLLSVTLGQVWYLKRFFETRRKI